MITLVLLTDWRANMPADLERLISPHLHNPGVVGIIANEHVVCAPNGIGEFHCQSVGEEQRAAVLQRVLNELGDVVHSLVDPRFEFRPLARIFGRVFGVSDLEWFPVRGHCVDSVEVVFGHAGGNAMGVGSRIVKKEKKNGAESGRWGRRDFRVKCGKWEALDIEAAAVETFYTSRSLSATPAEDNSPPTPIAYLFSLQFFEFPRHSTSGNMEHREISLGKYRFEKILDEYYIPSTSDMRSTDRTLLACRQSDIVVRLYSIQTLIYLNPGIEVSGGSDLQMSTVGTRGGT
ncbi:hypothetical protein C8R45DRAFT_943164 [Mycena sanguinolenta]|nr:hypothetical protein C8R45DRAFT_943164 [Mycena sanguinolenta]